MGVKGQWVPGRLPQIASAWRAGWCALLTSKVLGPSGMGVRLGGVGLLIATRGAAAAIFTRQVVVGHGSKGPRQRQEARRAAQLGGVEPRGVRREGHGGNAAAAGRRRVHVGEVLQGEEGEGRQRFNTHEATVKSLF